MSSSEPSSSAQSSSAQSSSEIFTEHRPLLFTIVYEILGSAADTEDVLQDSYIRWSQVDPAEVDNPRAYLARIASRLALNQLRTAQRRREDYPGNWLPEPIQTASDVSDDAVLAESVSIAMLLVLETLSPDERAVFVLHTVFGYTFPEVADMVGKTDVAVRQIAHRARAHVQARRRRFQPESRTATEVVEKFFAAATSGDIQGLMDLMSPDVVEISDGGGHVSAARRPVLGPERVARFVLGIARGELAEPTFELTTCNAQPAMLVRSRGALEFVLLFDIVDNVIQGLYAVLNPEKLATAHLSNPLARDKD
ncbi:RNA polymerase sigma-70 factor [Antrihabitans sp. NCIMB 15449]|uniref:RNA polymerase sigma-70 factor n=1 Tax=Antrihabitans spumae TaxID=3373370 RepID=A0ABW7JM69_9NOCA